LLNDKTRFEEVSQAIWDDFDANKDGKIDSQEFTNFMTKFFNSLELPLPSPEQIKVVMTKLDVNQDGKLSYEEIKPIIQEIISLLITID